MKKTTLLWFAFAPLFVACAGPAIAEDLLQNVERQEQPLSPSAPQIAVTIAEGINNHEKIDQSVEQSLRIALANANVFGDGAAAGYRISADIVTASIAAMSFGDFEGKLDVHYVVHDGAGRLVLDETIHTVAGSDTWYFSGAARHQRSRAVQMARNATEFVGLLTQRMRGGQ